MKLRLMKQLQQAAEAVGSCRAGGLVLAGWQPAGALVWEPWPFSAWLPWSAAACGVPLALAAANGIGAAKCCTYGTGRCADRLAPGNRSLDRPACRGHWSPDHGPQHPLSPHCRHLRMWPRQLGNGA